MTAIETTIWDLHTPLPLSTSILYPLMPLGVGTPLVESLTSYLKRLAHTHHVKVADLVRFCGTQTNAQVLLSTLQKLSRIDGITTSAQSWSELLSTLTCREEVICLTMNYWRSLLNPYRILRQYHAWCPLCYADAVQKESPLYEPLLWRLHCVEVCPVHYHQLVENCPTCGCQFTTLSNRAVIGYCPKCQHWLGNPSSAGKSISIQADASQVVHAVGQLLSLAPCVNSTQWNPISEVIPIVRQRQQVNCTQLERALHTGTSALTKLLSGQRQPSLEVFARLTAFSGDTFWELLAQPTHDTTILVPHILPVVHNEQRSLDELLISQERLPCLSDIAHRCGFETVTALRKAYPIQHDLLWQRIHEEQRLVLEQALQQSVPVVLSKWAQQHGYKTQDLYHHFYDLCLQVTQRFHVDKEARCRGYLQSVLTGETFPTLTEIRKALGVGDHYLSQYFAVELLVIEAKRQQQIQQTEALAGEYLNQVLSGDDESISLEQIAQAVGKSRRYLKNNFPLQSQLLLSRRRAYIAQQVQATCDCIHQTVFDLHRQGIYPSIDRIHAVIGTWMIHGKAYRHTYIEAMTVCGHFLSSEQ